MNNDFSTITDIGMESNVNIFHVSPSEWYMVPFCSFYTFSRMIEVKEIVVVCDPSYEDIFEGCRYSFYGSSNVHICALPFQCD